jgi:aspartate aminotransferase-like enzyme
MGCGVALDCVSSVGAVRIRDEAGSLLMASGVSGKSIGSYAGLAFVGVSETARRLLRGKELPPSFDLTRMLDTQGPVSTVPSPLLYALSTALQQYGSAEAAEERFREYERLGLEVRRGLRAAGMTPLAQEWHAAPNITTFVLPHDEFANECSREGFQIAHESAYLATRSWGQVATMGNISREEVMRFFATTVVREAGPLKISERRAEGVSLG